MILGGLIYFILYLNHTNGTKPVDLNKLLQDRLFRHRIVQSVSKFTNYHLYYQTYRQTINFYDINNFNTSSYQCFPEEAFNQTHMVFLHHVNRCVSSTYRYRQLTNDDVAWRSMNKSKEVKQSTETTVEVAYPYLIVALYLPHHPFSSELLESLFTAAPMFPAVTIATINTHKHR
jgi:hypothetical protein